MCRTPRVVRERARWQSLWNCRCFLNLTCGSTLGPHPRPPVARNEREEKGDGQTQNRKRWRRRMGTNPHPRHFFFFFFAHIITFKVQSLFKKLPTATFLLPQVFITINTQILLYCDIYTPLFLNMLIENNFIRLRFPSTSLVYSFLLVASTDCWCLQYPNTKWFVPNVRKCGFFLAGCDL